MEYELETRRELKALYYQSSHLHNENKTEALDADVTIEEIKIWKRKRNFYRVVEGVANK